MIGLKEHQREHIFSSLRLRHAPSKFKARHFLARLRLGYEVQDRRCRDRLGNLEPPRAIDHRACRVDAIHIEATAGKPLVKMPGSRR
jgi:hypothetical protein